MNQQNLGQGGNVQPDGTGGNPVWQEYLKDIPDTLKPVVEGAFKKWDAQVTQRFQEIHNQYAPLKAYEPLVQHQVPLERVAQALQFAEQLEADPKAMALKMNETFKLGLTDQPVQQQTGNEFGSEFDNLGEVDVTQHPMFKQMQQALESIQNTLTTQEQQRKQEDETEQFYSFLDNLVAGKPHLENNDDAKLLIANFMTGGMDASQALAKVDSIFIGQAANITEQQLQQTNTTTDNGAAINNDGSGQSSDTDPLKAYLEQQANSGGQQVEDQAPVVMGGAGTVGSGSPTAPINFGTMPSKDVSSLVVDVLKASQNSE